MTVPEQYGGSGMGLLAQIVVSEELYYCAVPFPMASVPNILYEARGEQIDRLLKPVIAGEKTACFAQTEPNAGSDPGGMMKTRATRTDGGWLINGSKLWISNAHSSDFMQVQAVTDPEKRQRGRRGLDLVEEIKAAGEQRVQIRTGDVPGEGVDAKLVNLARDMHATIVTTDYALNKVARIQGIEVLNINELANALKPAVLPGETLSVRVIREGREYDQGVAYLDDGTMVVVDNARKLISRTIEITVTSVLQTTAGKMIFGRYDDRIHLTEKPAERAAHH